MKVSHSDSMHVSEGFTTIASDYSKAAFIAQKLAQQMLERLQWIRIEPQVIIDAGCGIGHDLVLLQHCFPNALVVGLDISSSMLTHIQDDRRAVLGDMMNSPLKQHSVDLIFANLLLPWCSDLPALFKEWLRVLKPGGLLLFSTFGTGSLIEVPSTPAFIDIQDLGDLLLQLGFIDPVLDNEQLRVEYRSAELLKAECTAQGLAILFPENTFPECAAKHITFEIVYGQAWSPTSTQEESGTVSIPVKKFPRFR